MRVATPSRIDFKAIPEELTALRRWAVWKTEARDGKPTKVPYQARRPETKARSDDLRTWAYFDKAREAFEAGGFDGIFFATSPDDPIVGVDLDGVFDPETGEMQEEAARIIDQLASYTEISPSGKGVRIFLKGCLNSLIGRKKGQVEVYDRGRFLSVTGNVYGPLGGVVERQAELEAFHLTVWPPKPPASPRRPTQPTNADDETVLERARNNATGAKFGRLWNGDISDYPKGNGEYDHSAADLALCNRLRFETGDPVRVDELFRKSGLMREKWDEVHYADGTTYGQHTVEKAMDGDVRGQRASVTTPPRAPAEEPEGNSEPDLLMFLRTDYGNAERLVAMHGADIRFCPARGWLIWDGRRWAIDEGPGITRKALETARALFTQASRVEDSDRRAEWIKHSLMCERKAALENAITLAKSVPGINVSIGDFDQDPMLLNLLNGTIDLRTGTLREHRRGDLITKLAPVTYDPAVSCPLWLEFQRTITGSDQDLIDFKQRALGYSLTGDITEHVLFIAYGNGRNGKGTEAETIREVLGEYAQTSPFDTFAIRSSDAIRNDVARLVGSRLVTASEGDAGKRLAESLVKQLTGGDTVAARFLLKEFFEFRPQFKLWLATNHKPVIRGTDEGIWSRIRLMPYTVTIPEEKRDGKLPEKLKGELSGILNWMLEGCLAWQCNGLQTAKAVKDATGDYRAESDILSGFLSGKCERDELHSVPAKDLYEAYTRWCNENGDEALSGTMFGRLLNERGFMAKKIGGKVYRQGLSLQQEGGQQDS